MLSLFVMLAAIDDQHLCSIRACKQACFNSVPFFTSLPQLFGWGSVCIGKVVCILGFSRETEPARMCVCIKRFIDGELAYVIMGSGESRSLVRASRCRPRRTRVQVKLILLLRVCC